VTKSIFDEGEDADGPSPPKLTKPVFADPGSPKVFSEPAKDIFEKGVGVAKGILEDDSSSSIDAPPLLSSSGNKNKAGPSSSPANDKNMFDFDEEESLKQQVAEYKARSEKSDKEKEKLAKEVAELKKKLKKEKENTEKAEARAVAADERLATHKAKEAADTKVLEDMIAQVEENLIKTTARAQQAEAQIEQLKAELAKGGPIGDPEQLRLRIYDAKDKARVASSMLYKASADAEVSIRELMKGIETLKNASHVLNAIDKVTGPPP